MTNKFRMGAAGIAIAAAFSMASAAQAADTATATATAEVVQALTLQKDADMDFGKVVVAGAGTVDLATDGTPTCSANITCYSTTSAADFSITTGSIGKSVTVNLPSATDLIRVGAVDPGTGYAAADKIELDTFTTDATSNNILDGGGNVIGQYYTVTLADDGSGNGSAAFSIGGTIHLDGSEVEGVYQNTITVSVEYT